MKEPEIKYTNGSFTVGQDPVFGWAILTTNRGWHPISLIDRGYLDLMIEAATGDERFPVDFVPYLQKLKHKEKPAYEPGQTFSNLRVAFQYNAEYTWLVLTRAGWEPVEKQPLGTLLYLQTMMAGSASFPPELHQFIYAIVEALQRAPPAKPA